YPRRRARSNPCPARSDTTMTIEEFAQLVPGFSTMGHVEKIKCFVWFLQAHRSQNRVSATDIRGCYAALHYVPPGNPSSLMRQMKDTDPPDLLRHQGGYRLEG